MSKQIALSRRCFLRSAGRLAFGAGLGLAAPEFFFNRTKAASGENPSELVRVGFIGLGGQGNHNLGKLLEHAAAVCDVDKSHLADAQKRVERAHGRPCRAYHDYRELLEDHTIDAVLISTPDHWHTLPALHACEAGKDVYCEKPLTLFIREGQVLVNAVRRHRRVFQTGSQQRSDPNFLKACEYVRSGRIGKVKTIKVGLPGVNWDKKGATAVADGAPPPELDYNFWLGPAPQRPYNKNRVHYLFRFFWDYSGGQMTNWGAHHLDIAQWGLGTDQSGPVEITPGEVVYNAEKLFETPQKFDVQFKYADGTLLLCSSGTGKDKGGTRFEGEKGMIFVSRGALESEPKEVLQAPLDEHSVRLYASSDHHQNWIECIKSRKDPICNIEIGHRSASLCHLGNIAVRTGRKVMWDPATEKIIGDAESAKWTRRPYRVPWELPGF